MAGDSDLEAPHPQPCAHPHPHDDEPALLSWLRWFFKVRFLIPFTFVPGVWFVCRQLGAPCNLNGVLAVTLIGYLANTLVALVLRRDVAELARDRRRLEHFVSSMTLLDTLTLSAAVYFAGGAMGPLWPFPFIPLLLCAALLQSMRSLAINSVVATLLMALSLRPETASDLFGPVLLVAQFIGFGAMLVISVSRGARHQQRVSHELEHARTERRLAEAVAKRREEILSVVSHELASPLMTLRGYVKLMQESKSRDRDAHLLQRVDRQVARISSLADDLLQMASTKSGALRLRRSSFDLVAALHMLRDGVLVHDLEANIDITGESHCFGVWDHDRLDQLFGNLVSNAVKFAGARSRVGIDVQHESPRLVHVRVHDDGPGISAEALPRVFEPFQRYSSERGGLGLGLAIARSVTLLHGGRIWAESPIDQRGATIHVVLPTDLPAEQRPVPEDVDGDDDFSLATRGKQ